MSTGRSAIGGAVVLVVVFAVVAGGCRGRSAGASVPRGAASHLEPVGPLELVAASPDPGGAESTGTAVHMAGESREPVPLVPDSKLRIDVGMRLEEAPVDFSGVDLDIERQRVRLTGTVESLRARDRAELIARSVTGVREVDNRLTVAGAPAPDPSSEPDDKRQEDGGE